MPQRQAFVGSSSDSEPQGEPLQSRAMGHELPLASLSTPGVEVVLARLGHPLSAARQLRRGRKPTVNPPCRA